jgi:hypothetical protein
VGNSQRHRGILVSLLAAVVLATGVAQAAPAPPASPSPPPTIIRIRATPFCQVFRDNILSAVNGLRYNDRVIDESKSTLAKWAYDTVMEDPRVDGAGLEMDHYQLGQLVFQVAHNLERVHQLLNDTDRIPAEPHTDADRDLAEMRDSLQYIADAQARWLNLLSGTYETAVLNDFLSRGNDAASAVSRQNVPQKRLDLGDPVFTSPGASPMPIAAAQPDASLVGATQAGRLATVITNDKHDTGAIQDLVAGAVMPGVKRCSNANPTPM